MQRQQHTFASLLEHFAKRKLSTERRAMETQRDIRRDLLPGLGLRRSSDYRA